MAGGGNREGLSGEKGSWSQSRSRSIYDPSRIPQRRARRDPSPRSGSGSGGPRRPVRSGEPLGLPLGAEPPVTFPGSRAAAAPARRAWSPAPAHAAASTWLHHCVLVARLRQPAASPAPRVSGFRTWEGAHARGDARRVTEARNPAPCPRPPPPEVHALGGSSGSSPSCCCALGRRIQSQICRGFSHR